MLIYLDTKDLINILEESYPLSVEQLEKSLRCRNHKLVFSFMTIMEIAEPLLHKKATSNVMGLLNRLEKLPHTYIHSNTSRLELQEAIRAFSTGGEYKSIFPFVNRFDETVDLNASPPTKQYINYPLAEIVWDLHSFGALGGLDKYAEKLRQTFTADRVLFPKPSLKANFRKTIDRNIRLHRLSNPPQNIQSFADWVYSDPSRCPSERLGYEVWHKMVRNTTDIPEDSDLEDFQHIGFLPYIDAMTLDRRMCGYVSQAVATLGLDYSEKIYKNAQQLIDSLLVTNCDCR